MSTLKCNYCGLAPDGYKNFYRNKVYCSQEHLEYDTRKQGWSGGSDTRTSDEIQCATGGSHEGYSIPAAGSVVTTGGCGYCSRKPTTWQGSWKGKVYCSEAHMRYDMMKTGSVDFRTAEEKAGAASMSHAGFVWRPVKPS